MLEKLVHSRGECWRICGNLSLFYSVDKYHPPKVPETTEHMTMKFLPDVKHSDEARNQKTMWHNFTKFCRIFTIWVVTIWDIDLKLSGFISYVNSDNLAKFREVSIPRTCISKNRVFRDFGQ